jgi:hypothetical protein
MLKTLINSAVEAKAVSDQFGRSVIFLAEFEIDGVSTRVRMENRINTDEGEPEVVDIGRFSMCTLGRKE